MGNPVVSQPSPPGVAARPDYQRRLVPIAIGAAIAMALGLVAAPQVERTLHPDFDAASVVQRNLAQAIRADGELRAALAVLTMQFADRRQQCDQPQRPVAGQPLRLPQSVLTGSNLTPVVGCWQAASGMKNARSGEDLTIEMCFGARSVESLVLVEPGGNQCSQSQMTTDFAGRELIVSSRAALECKDGKTYLAPTIVCRPGADDLAECQVRTGSSPALPLQFTRK